MMSSLAASHHDNRVCRKCNQAYPVDMFPVYRAKGYEGRRHQCRSCIRAYRTRWELELSPGDAARYYKRKGKADARWKKREQKERYRTRLMYLKNALNALLATGLTRKAIAERAGVSPRTVRRILNDEPGRVRFSQPTEERILAVYWNVKETQT